MKLRHCGSCYTWTFQVECPVCGLKGELYNIHEVEDDYLEILLWYMASEINRTREILERIKWKMNT